MERFEVSIRIFPGRFLGSVDDERSNDYNDCTDNQYREPNGVATGRNLAGRDEAQNESEQ